MKIARYRTAADPSPRVGMLDGDAIRPLGPAVRLADVLHAADPAAFVREAMAATAEAPIPAASAVLLAPIEAQEVWGAGVTYERSKVAREEESEKAATFYDMVYRADRPELFFKATPSRVVGPGGAIRVRVDSRWCVPEPELALVLSPDLRVVGYTIGDDVSARDIEGENPLYLPQAKMYDACCALGPAIVLVDSAGLPPGGEIGIRLVVERGGAEIVRGASSVARMARTFEDLISWLGRDNLFPDGVILLTGTGVVPPDDFSLEAGDVVRIEVDGVGLLENSVVRG